MAAIESNSFLVELSADGGTTFKSLVCEENSSATFETATTSRVTKCGTFSTGSEQTATFDYTGVVKSDPTGTELSYETVLGYWKAGTALVIRRENPALGANIYQKADVTITSIGDESNAGDLVSFNVTFTVSDTSTLDFTP